MLLDYDIFHLEWGLEFYRDGRFVKELKKFDEILLIGSGKGVTSVKTIRQIG